MMLAKGCLGIVQKRVIYECLVQTEQNKPDQIKTPGEVAARNGGAGWKLFTWADGRGLRRGPLQDAFSLLARTSLNPPEYVPAAVVPENRDPCTLEAEPTVRQRCRPSQCAASVDFLHPLSLPAQDTPGHILNNFEPETDLQKHLPLMHQLEPH